MHAPLVGLWSWLTECVVGEAVVNQKNAGIAMKWIAFAVPWQAKEYGSPHRQKTQPSNSPAAPVFSTTAVACRAPVAGRDPGTT